MKSGFSDFQIKFICARHACDEIEVRKSSISTDEMKVALNKSPQSQNHPTENHAKKTQKINATSFIQSLFIIYFPFTIQFFFKYIETIDLFWISIFFFKYLEKFDLCWITIYFF